MKCSLIELILAPEDAKAAGAARLAKEDDNEVTTQEQAAAYRGACFTENPETTRDLHLVYRDGLACVNFINEDGVRVNYDYPLAGLKRIKRIAN